MDFFVQAPNHGIISGGSHVFRARKPGTPVQRRTQPFRTMPIQRLQDRHGAGGRVVAQPGTDEERAAVDGAAGQAEHDAQRLGVQYEEGDDVGLRAGAGHRVDVRTQAWENKAVECVGACEFLAACRVYRRVVESKLHSALARKAAQQHDGGQGMQGQGWDEAPAQGVEHVTASEANNVAKLAVDRAMALLDDDNAL